MGGTQHQGSGSVVELRSVGRSFAGKRVLSAFELVVMPGEFVVIMGRSGSGKSTLLNIIGLLDEADEGSVLLFGNPSPRLFSVEAQNLLRSKLAYIFQSAALVDQDTVEKNLLIAQRYSDLPKGERGAARKAALAGVGLEGMENKKVFQLSGGEQQRLAVSCIQMHPSELVLADEPTGSLDAANRDVVVSALRGFTKQGKTVIVVTHDQVVADMADRIVRLD